MQLGGTSTSKQGSNLISDSKGGKKLNIRVVL